jgi:thymidine kinase
MASLNFRYSSMDAGKSTALLQLEHNYKKQGLDVNIYTPLIDDRYECGYVTSRLGPQSKANVFDDRYNFWMHYSSLDIKPICILIDESQFLSIEQVRQLHRVAQLLGIQVICYGLRTDSSGDPFPGASYLLALADDIEEIKSICRCASKATMTIRLDRNGNRIVKGPQILIGGNDQYRQVCAKCFYISTGN